MSGTEAPRWKDKGLDRILKHAPEPCLFFCCCRNTHALHGFRGSGHSSAESEELWTRPTWRYRAPETQQARRHKPWNSVSGERKSNTWFCTNNLQAIFFDGNNPPPASPTTTMWVQWLALYKACPGRATARHRHIKAWKEQLQAGFKWAKTQGKLEDICEWPSFSTDQ